MTKIPYISRGVENIGSIPKDGPKFDASQPTIPNAVQRQPQNTDDNSQKPVSPNLQRQEQQAQQPQTVAPNVQQQQVQQSQQFKSTSEKREEVSEGHDSANATSDIKGSVFDNVDAVDAATMIAVRRHAKRVVQIKALMQRVLENIKDDDLREETEEVLSDLARGNELVVERLTR